MKKKGMWWAGGIVLLSALLIGILSWVNGYFILAPAVQLELYGDAAMEIAAHSVYEEPGFLARKGRNDLRDLVATEGEVDASKPGVYTITYRLTMKGKEYTQQRVVTVVDREAPALELLGEAQLKISAKHLYEEAGYSAFDRCDGDLTEAVKVTEHMEGDLLTLTYTVKDASGNSFAPFVAEHYKNTYVIDYRNYKGSLDKLVNETGAMEIIFYIPIENTNISSTASKISKLA